MERFSVVYGLIGTYEEAYARAKDICLEQSVEFPGELVPPGFIQDHIVGRIEDFVPDGARSYRTTVSFALESAADELTQLLNVIFGNISIKPGYRVEAIKLPQFLTCKFKGPRWGRSGIRKLLGVPKRPLLFTALKPMGLTSEELARLAYQFALGGIDIIKDDHGLTNQNFAPFNERVRLCATAVTKANHETGRKSIYVANVTAPHGEVSTRAYYAKEQGAGALLIAPGIVGFDTMRALSDDDDIGLPIFSHPALLGSYVLSPEHGISHSALFGQITRLAGADGTIYPNFGGRFSFSREECISIIEGTAVPMGELKPIFPCPGGGMSLNSIPEMHQIYGSDVIYLIGGGLFRHGPDIVENCRHFRRLVDAYESQAFKGSPSEAEINQSSCLNLRI